MGYKIIKCNQKLGNYMNTICDHYGLASEDFL